MKRQLTKAAFVVAITGVLSWLGPIVGSRLIRENSTVEPQTGIVALTKEGYAYAVLPWHFLAVDVPRSMPISQTVMVRARLEVEKVHDIACAFRGPAFEVAPSTEFISKKAVSSLPSGHEIFHWEWLIHPRYVGQHAVFFQFKDADANEGSFPAVINVLTVLGLTAQQDAVLKGIGGVVGLLSAIGIWKRFFERKVEKPRPPSLITSS